MCAHRPSKPGPPKILDRCKTETLDLWLRYLTAAVLIYPILVPNTYGFVQGKCRVFIEL